MKEWDKEKKNGIKNNGQQLLLETHANENRVLTPDEELQKA